MLFRKEERLMDDSAENTIKKIKNYESLTLAKIDTNESVDSFIGYLKYKNTYFFNGKWGSGKTEFLKAAEEKLKNNKGTTKHKKFIYLDLWRIDDERSILEITYSNLRPKLTMFYKIFIVSCVVISLIMSPAINLGLSSYLNSNFLNFLAIIPLFVAVLQFFKVKTDKVYAQRLRSFRSDDKVLIIDDFDRLSVEKQEEAYRVFNLLNGKLPIIFVGDYNLIARQEEKYLQKIINKRIELPYALHSKSIWEDYFSMLNKELEFEINPLLKELFVTEDRNLRDRNVFNNYVEEEFFARKKKGRVQVNQQLAILYMYVFVPKEYVQLLSSQSITPSEEYIKFSKDNKGNSNGLRFNYTKRSDVFYQILQDNNSYPESFNRKPSGYFIYENLNNLSEEQALEIVGNNILLRDELIDRGSIEQDFYYYILTNYNNNLKKFQHILVATSLDLLAKNKYSPAIKIIIQLENNNFKSPKNSAIERAFDNWDSQLIKRNLDYSQKLHFYSVILGFRMTELIANMSFSEEYINDQYIFKRKEFYFIAYMEYKKETQFKNSEYILWKDEGLKIIKTLEGEPFVRFLISQKILVNEARIDVSLSDDIYGSYMLDNDRIRSLFGSESLNDLEDLIVSKLNEVRLKEPKFKFYSNINQLLENKNIE